LRSVKNTIRNLKKSGNQNVRIVLGQEVESKSYWQRLQHVPKK
jgi:hypothetical protein